MFRILPILVVLFFFGLSMLQWQLSEAVPGAGPAGRMETNAEISEEEIEMYATTCEESVLAIEEAGNAPPVYPALVPIGEMALPKDVSLPGAFTAINASGIPMAGCTAVEEPFEDASVRYIYAYMPAKPGAEGLLLENAENEADWFRVHAANVATNISDEAETIAVPSTIPVGSMLYRIPIASPEK